MTQKRRFFWVYKSAKSGLFVSPTYAKRWPGRTYKFKVFY